MYVWWEWIVSLWDFFFDVEMDCEVWEVVCGVVEILVICFGVIGFLFCWIWCLFI